MSSKQVIKFVRKKLNQGMGKRELRRALSEMNYSRARINEILDKAENGPGSGSEGTWNKIKNKFAPIFRGGPEKSRIFKSIALLIGLILIVGGSILIYSKLSKTDPISLLPKQTSFYARVKIDPDHQQVKNLKGLLKKFPLYEDLSSTFKEQLEEAEPEGEGWEDLSYSDFAVSEEIILASVAPLDLEGSNSKVEEDLVLILPFLDRKKLKDLESKLEPTEEEVKTEKLKYRSWTITEIKSKESEEETIYMEEELGTTSDYYAEIKSHLVFSPEKKNIEKIIDVVKDRKLTNLFKEDKAKSINSDPTYKKVKKHLPDKHLALIYGNVSMDEIMRASEGTKVAERIKNTELGSPLKASLDFFGGNSEKDSEDKRAIAAALIAKENSLETEAYVAGMDEELKSTEFDLEKSLSQKLPRKTGERETIYYAESKNLHEDYENLKRQSFKEASEEDKEQFEEGLKEFEKTTNLNAEENIKLLKGNYASLLITDATGDKPPVLAFAARSEEAEQLEQNLSEMELPKDIAQPMSGARAQARDARITSEMGQLRSKAELIASEEGSYAYLSCDYDSETQSLCKDIKEQNPDNEEGVQIHASWEDYCAYAPLNSGGYYCVNSAGEARTTAVNPQQTCNGTQYGCPENSGATPTYQTEKISPSQETVNGIEVYTLPLIEDFELSFAAEDNKFLLSSNKETIPEIMEDWDESPSKALQQHELFSKQFKEAPQEVSGIFYTFPYGYRGPLKYTAKAFAESGFGAIMGMGSQQFKEITFEIIDRGIAPYLKTVKVGSSYTYSTDSDVRVSKGSLVIEELPKEEKEDVEDFWNNFESWIRKKTSPVLQQSRAQARDARITSEMGQFRSKAELVASDEGSYASCKCGYDSETQSLCDDIAQQCQTGSSCEDVENGIEIHTSSDSYCAYSGLNSGEYYCVDSTGQAGTVSSSPESSCNAYNFKCPSSTSY